MRANKMMSYTLQLVAIPERNGVATNCIQVLFHIGGHGFIYQQNGREIMMDFWKKILK
jgi:hypothetical protein